MYMVLNLLRKVRLEARVSPSDIARRSGYSKQHISLIELDRVRPSPHCQMCLANALQLPVAEIFPVVNVGEGKKRSSEYFLPRGEGGSRKRNQTGKRNQAVGIKR